MAITQIKVLSKFSVPGGGRDSNTGLAKNNKVIVTGEIQGTWADTTGLDLRAYGGPRTLGLSQLDFIDLDVKSVAGTNSADEAQYTAGYNHNLHRIFIVLDGTTNPTADDACIVNFFAIGDDFAAQERN